MNREDRNSSYTVGDVFFLIVQGSNLFISPWGCIMSDVRSNKTGVYCVRLYIVYIFTSFVQSDHWQIKISRKSVRSCGTSDEYE